MSDIKLKLGYKHSTLRLPFIFVDEYMLNCLPVYPLIYIWSFRRLMDGESATVAEITERFQLTEGDVINAWRHWEKERLVTISHGKQGMEITFLEVNERERQQTELKILPIVESRPQYSSEELACYRTESQDVERLFALAEKTLGKLLTYNDMAVIFGFYDWLRLPLDVIEYLLTYCEENDRRNLRYIEKCAIDWAENEIKDLESAFLYVQNFDKNYRTILRHMGQISGNPTPSHKKYMKKWLHDWHIPLELVTEACDRCVEQIAKPNFKYVDKILSEWNKKGVSSIKDVASIDEEFIKELKKPAVIKQKPNRFANFKQRDIDYSQYEKLEREYLEQKYNAN